MKNQLTKFAASSRVLLQRLVGLLDDLFVVRSIAQACFMASVVFMALALFFAVLGIPSANRAFLIIGLLAMGAGHISRLA